MTSKKSLKLRYFLTSGNKCQKLYLYGHSEQTNINYEVIKLILNGKVDESCRLISNNNIQNFLQLFYTNSWSNKNLVVEIVKYTFFR